MKKHRGFTLIEFFVCLSIFALIMAILLPVLNHAGHGNTVLSSKVVKSVEINTTNNSVTITSEDGSTHKEFHMKLLPRPGDSVKTYWETNGNTSTPQKANKDVKNKYG